MEYCCTVIKNHPAKYTIEQRTHIGRGSNQWVGAKQCHQENIFAGFEKEQGIRFGYRASLNSLELQNVTL